jgi:hypothetical protein
MNIKLFFEISKEFFDSMYSYLEEDETEETTNEEDTTNEKKIDEEKGWNEYGYDDNLCYCNGCNIYRQFALFIDPNIDNDKSD